MLRTGIIGNGRIVSRFIREIRTVSDMDPCVVYNPHPGSAESFAQKNDIPFWTDNIDELFDKVDAVYIASPHSSHEEYTGKALNAGKHVLCEKPMSLSEGRARELYELASSKGLVLLEAVKTAFCPGFNKLNEIVSSGKIGRIIDVEAAFSKLTPLYLREMTDEEYGGSFIELGSYVLLPALRFLGRDYKEIRFDPVTAPNGLDGYTKTSLIYEGGVSATLKTGLLAKTEGELIISGTQGYIYARAPWWLTSHFEVRGEDPSKKEIFECEYKEAGLRYEIEAFRDMIEGRSCFDRQLLERESLARAAVMEEFIRRRKEDKRSLPGGMTLGIWGHRGASYDYPENTIPAFEAAARIPGIRGIEMDIQRTKDGQIVVFHDESVDRIMDGDKGKICELTLAQLKAMKMKGTDDPKAVIPTLDEFLDAMKPYSLEKGLLINIELKTSVVRYEGIEKEAYDIVKKHDMLPFIVWSSFLADSIRIIKEIDPEAKTGMLGAGMADIMKRGDEAGCDAYHPHELGMAECDIETALKIRSSGRAVRAWTGNEPLFINKKDMPMPSYDRKELAKWGVTDIITNMPDKYLGK